MPLPWAIILILALKTGSVSMRTSAHPIQKHAQIHMVVRPISHILRGNASTGPVRPVKNRLVPSIVIIRGAVSPAILDMAKITPVSTPSLAFLRTIKKVIFDFEIPRNTRPHVVNWVLTLVFLQLLWIL